jgi:hypothetical protein
MAGNGIGGNGRSHAAPAGGPPAGTLRTLLQEKLPCGTGFLDR